MSVIISRNNTLETITLEVGQSIAMTPEGLIIKTDPIVQLKQMLDKTVLAQIIPLIPTDNCQSLTVINKDGMTYISCAGYIFVFKIPCDQSFTYSNVRNLYPDLTITNSSEKPIVRLKQLIDVTTLAQLLPLFPTKIIRGIIVSKGGGLTQVSCAGHIFRFPIPFDDSFTAQAIRDLYPAITIPESSDYTLI